MRILQISCSYLPDILGGTEVYVHTLSQELLSRGHTVFVHYAGEFCEKGAQGVRAREYNFKGVPVFTIETNTAYLKTADIYFDSSEKSAPLFKEYLERIAPDIVHFHHFSPSTVITQMKIAKGMGLPIVLTYHAPTMTCGYGDMRYLGDYPCDGVLEEKRCMRCILTRYGVPLACANLWSRLPPRLARAMYAIAAMFDSPSRFSTLLQLPHLNKIRIERLKSGFSIADYFVAVCQWGFEILLKNGIPPEKIVVCRQGITPVPVSTRRKRDDTLRVGYLGRIEPLKGIEVLLKSFQIVGDRVKIVVYVYGAPEKGGPARKYYDKLIVRYADKRILWSGRLSENDKFLALSQLDILVIPSLLQETGPLVLLEAWAVGTPVISSRIGGMLELIHDEAGGLLFETGNAKDLAKAIIRVAQEPGVLARLQSTIPPVRTVKEVASDMEGVYHRLKKR